MNLMLSHELGQYRPQGMETCALCEEDDSVDDDRKRHTYTVGHLREHVAQGTTQRAKTQLAARKIEAQKSDSSKRNFEQPVPVPGQSGIVWTRPGQVVGEDLENPGPGIIFGAAPGSSGYKPSIKPIPGVITNAPPPDSPGWKPTVTKPPRRAY
ncbi:hypothetical protein CGCSCA4_v006566 [Colletotrichum siamense]|uniref:Uncharacterized protein n=1 Tax=Colletotrichum siamense TaxID=690259 RepID=A0A9P5BQD6_COLSI|nr:hypothetical protein CGCSCA4_v006566 [Colletotrichum siamense]KAF4847688.1 hypothetical protein CGCSCA2_v012633 [Colletotrichum siamense]